MASKGKEDNGTFAIAESISMIYNLSVSPTSIEFEYFLLGKKRGILKSLGPSPLFPKHPTFLFPL